jgi:oligopeptide/dipeptide ABC transporter ATP-binding protein
VSTSSAVIETVELRTSFEVPGGTVVAVDDVSLSISKGSTVGIVGESGSGKSVLVRSIMGLLTQRNVSRTGTVLYEGRDLTGLKHRAMRRLWGSHLAIVVQDPMTSLNPVLTIERQMTEPIRRLFKVRQAAARERARSILSEVGIPDAATRLREYPHQLSGGMRQRVAIAAALACEPEVLFADEPTTALDVTVQAQILDLLQEEQRSRHMTVVLVTHDLGVAAGRTDEIVVMYAGQVVEQAPTRDLFANMQMPYTAALLESIPRLDTPAHSRLTVIPGRPPNPLEVSVGCRFAPRCSFAADRCREEPPPLRQTGSTTGHWYRCWFPLGGAGPRFANGSKNGAADGG